MARLFQDFHEDFTPFLSCSTHPHTPKLNPLLQVVFTRTGKKNVCFKIIFCKFMGVSNYDSEGENRKSCWRQLNSIVVCAWAMKLDSLTIHLTSTPPPGPCLDTHCSVKKSPGRRQQRESTRWQRMSFRKIPPQTWPTLGAPNLTLRQNPGSELLQ